MGDYSIWRCNNCLACIVTITEWHDVECCDAPKIVHASQCAQDTCFTHSKIDLPDHDDKDVPEPAPELRRRSRIELVLEELQ
jgi:hypothetical protein